MADDRDDFTGDEGFPSHDWADGDEATRRGEDAFDETAARPSGGRGWKIALIIVAVSALVVVLCCGVGGWFGYQWLLEQAQPTRNPEEVRAWTEEMISIEIPDDYAPEEGVTIGMGGFMTFRIITYTGPKESQLFFIELSGQAANNPQNRAQLEQSLRRNLSDLAKTIQEESSEIHEEEINGETVDFKFVTGPESITGETWTEVSGVIPTERGMVLMLLQAPAESFDKDEAMSMIGSIGE